MADTVLFVVFHRELPEASLQHLNPQQRGSVVAYAVNDTVPKTYPAVHVQKEWELHTYNPQFQSLGFNESSCHFHVYRNSLHRPYKTVAFAQYDMLIPSGLFLVPRGSIGYVSEQTLRTDRQCNPEAWRLLDRIVPPCLPEYTSTTIACLDFAFPLYSSFVLPCFVFEKMMEVGEAIQQSVVDSVYSNDPDQLHHRSHVGGQMERLWGIVLLILARRHQLDLVLLDVEHNSSR